MFESKSFGGFEKLPTKSAGVPGAVFGFLFQRVKHYRLEGLRYCGHILTQAARRFCRVLQSDGYQTRPAEGHRASEHFIEHYAQTVDVRGRSERLAIALFGRHVSRR